MAQMQTTLVTGNYFDKYRSPNRFHRSLVSGFVNAARSLLCKAGPTSVLEVGAGPGDLAAQLLTQFAGTPVSYLGTDVCQNQIEIAKQRYPQFSFQCASIYDLPVIDKSYDLCIACEVLEHLEEPKKALAELARVARRHVLISVPWEPTWRFLNCARGVYLAALGNTPGHIQHYSRRKIRNLVKSRFEIVEERRPFPWTMLLARQPI